jgi:hypothetical protein
MERASYYADASIRTALVAGDANNVNNLQMALQSMPR